MLENLWDPYTMMQVRDVAVPEVLIVVLSTL